MVRYKILNVNNLKLNEYDKRKMNKIENIRKKFDYIIKNIDWQGHQIVYQHPDKSTVQINIRSNTVTTNIYHPANKFTSKVRPNCNINDIIGILASPRIHLNKFKTKTIKHENNRKVI